MTKVIITEHLRLRLKQREFPSKFPEHIHQKSKRRFYDTIEKSTIAIMKLQYLGKLRNIMIAYVTEDESDKIKTIHPIKEKEIKTRIKNKRWIKK